MHTVFALLCFVVVIHWLIFPYPSGLLRWHCGNLTIAPVPAKQPWWIWINTSCEFIMNDYITTTKQSTTKPCAYLLGYTVYGTWWIITPHSLFCNNILFWINSWFRFNSQLLSVNNRGRFYANRALPMSCPHFSPNKLRKRFIIRPIVWSLTEVYPSKLLCCVQYRVISCRDISKVYSISHPNVPL